MVTTRLRCLSIVLLLALMGCGSDSKTPEQVAEEAIATFEDLGGEVRYIEGQASFVNLANTKVTDAGLVHLKGLPNLENLSLRNTQITDAGLVHLKGLTHLKGLVLFDTKISDAGLVHLKGLTKLEGLSLLLTDVTEEGVKGLRAALPKCSIAWKY